MKFFFTTIALFFATVIFPQDETILLKQADSFEKQFKEIDALNIYEQVASKDSSNIFVLVKCVELNCSIGEKQTDKKIKADYFQSAKSYADKAFAANPNNADANYAQALAFAKYTEIETENKKTVDDTRQIYSFGTKALSINPNHAKANYILGKWHYEMINLSWVKKVAIKTMYGNLPKPDIDSAIFYLEKCRSLDIYFLPDYLDLAKAYQYNNRPQQEIDVLTKMVRLPNRTADDAALKAEGQKMLSTLQ
jgi:tetratricopeptide (TPR) repeat protein